MGSSCCQSANRPSYLGSPTVYDRFYDWYRLPVTRPILIKYMCIGDTQNTNQSNVLENFNTSPRFYGQSFRVEGSQFSDKSRHLVSRKRQYTDRGMDLILVCVTQGKVEDDWYLEERIREIKSQNDDKPIVFILTPSSDFEAGVRDERTPNAYRLLKEKVSQLDRNRENQLYVTDVLTETQRNCNMLVSIALNRRDFSRKI